MMKASDTLRSTWAITHSEAGGNAGYYRRRLEGMGTIAVYAGVEVPSKFRKISISIPQGIFPSESLAHQTRGYGVIEEKKIAEGQVLVHICETGEHVPKDLFLIFCSDIIEHISRPLTAAEAVQILGLRLRHWRQFFENHSGDSLTLEEYIGLYAELSFLERCLDAGLQAIETVQSWGGPLGANQDFLFGPRAVEVKATTGNDQDLVRITNVRQLDDTGLEQLFLAHWAFDLRKNAGQTLRELVQSITHRLHSEPNALAIFDERLEFAGITGSASGPYEEFGFTSRNQRYYQVNGPFPRILESSMLIGVSDISYSIHLSAAVECSVIESDLMKLLSPGKVHVRRD